MILREVIIIKKIYDEKFKEEILDYLKKDAVYNTFLIADIEVHGFDKPYQSVYLQKDQFNKICGVALSFYNNLIVAGDSKYLDYGYILGLIDENIDTVMGKYEILKNLTDLEAFSKNHSQYRITNKNLLALYTSEKLLDKSDRVILANDENVEKIYDFLMDIPSFKYIYSAKEMIYGRIKSGEGVHMFIEEDGNIIAHVNSAAKTEVTNMVGGLGVKKELRGNRFAKQVLSNLCHYILEQNRTPCLFSDYNFEESLYKELGFEDIGKWGVINL